MNDRRLTYTMEETAQVLGVGRNLAYEAAARGEIPTVRLGRRLLVPRAALMAMLGQIDDDDDTFDGAA